LRLVVVALLISAPRYAFKKEHKEGQPIEVEDDDDWIDPSRKFYWNPYSGELSLTFPTSNTKAKGGILADAMGELAMCPSCSESI
jgi:DNA repair protein RAD5